MKIVVTGATGLIGSKLSEELKALGHDVTPYSFPRPAHNAIEPEDWHRLRPMFDHQLFQSADAVFNLAGENIKGVWTRRKKAQIAYSRSIPQNWVSEAMASKPGEKGILITASATGFYGEQGDNLVTEETPNGTNFLAETTQEWEAATQPATDAGVRVVLMRFGVVLSRKGGALKAMLLPFQMGLGTILGNGEQWMSWISLPDAVKAAIFCLENESISGPVNIVAPQQVQNRAFTKTLGKVVHRPALLKVPASALKAAFGKMAQETILGSCKVKPEKLETAKFHFDHPTLGTALRQVIRNKKG